MVKKMPYSVTFQKFGPASFLMTSYETNQFEFVMRSERAISINNEFGAALC